MEEVSTDDEDEDDNMRRRKKKRRRSKKQSQEKTDKGSFIRDQHLLSLITCVNSAHDSRFTVVSCRVV